MHVNGLFGRQSQESEEMRQGKAGSSYKICVSKSDTLGHYSLIALGKLVWNVHLRVKPNGKGKQEL